MSKSREPGRRSNGQTIKGTNLNFANASSFSKRKQINATATIPDGYALCRECFRIVPRVKSGKMKAHDYCQGPDKEVLPAWCNTHGVYDRCP